MIDKFAHARQAKLQGPRIGVAVRSATVEISVRIAFQASL